jgi:hypothetical protein
MSCDSSFKDVCLPETVHFLIKSMTDKIKKQKEEIISRALDNFFNENNGTIIFKLNIHVSSTSVSRRPQKTQK